MIKPEEVKVRYYNLNLNAFNHWHTDEVSRLKVGEKIAVSKRGRKFPKVAEAKLGNSFHLGHKQPDEAKKRISQKLTGRKLSEETRAKMRIAQQKRWQK